MASNSKTRDSSECPKDMPKKNSGFANFPVATNGASRAVSSQAKCLTLPVKVQIEMFGFARFRNSGHTKNN